MRRPPRRVFRCTGVDLCNVCGTPGGKMRNYHKPDYEHPGWGYCVSGEHGGCVAQVEAAGYLRHVGFPAHFPQVCGGCRHRAKETGRVETCANPNRGALRAIRSKADPMDVVGCTGRSAA